MVSCSSLRDTSEYSSIQLPEPGFGILHVYRQVDPATNKLPTILINSKVLHGGESWVYKCLYLKKGRHNISTESNDMLTITIESGKESFYRIRYSRSKNPLLDSSFSIGLGLVTEKHGIQELGASCAYI